MIKRIRKFLVTVSLVFAAIGALFLAGCGAANAASPFDGVYGVVTLASHHFPDRGYNQVNPGIGIEYDTGNWGFAAGSYKNSFYRRTNYAVVGYFPLTLGNYRFGGFVGPATGYAVPVAGGALIEYRKDRVGFNVMILPPAQKEGSVAVGLQVVFKF